MVKSDFKTKSLADLIDMDSPEAVFDEVLFIMTLIAPQMDPARLTNAFNLTVSLYRGVWPSEQACNTGFHDLRHITDTVLAMARLIHGAVLNGQRLNHRQIFMGIVATLAHDAGYIQDKKDGIGTGAKFTAVHVERSISFIERYGQRYGLTKQEIPGCQVMIQCTDLDTDVSGIRFPSKTIAFLAKLVAVADLIGQMADRIYLEKLFYLYREFKEGHVEGYADEMDLLRKTRSFFNLIAERLQTQLDGLDHLAAAHFKARWNIHRNLYHIAISNQKRYLEHILAHPDRDPSEFLRRKKIVSRLLGKQKKDS